MELFNLAAKLTLDTSNYDSGMDKSENKALNFASKAAGAVGKGLAAAAKIGTAAVSAAAVAVTGLTKAAIEQYAEYEQLTGGIETLYKDSAGTMLQYANEAFKTAGMSANEYMTTAIESSAAMINSLGGDTAKAAEMTNMAIIDMSDNVNKMGTTMEAVQNAYRGFSRGNFTMLDNLALGFAGTKEGMQQLLDTAEQLEAQQGRYRDFSINSYADIVEAIHIVQDNMGITGTTAREAATTIQGSLNAMKSAWNNLLTGLSGGTEAFGQDIDQLINNLIDSLIGYQDEAGVRVGGVINNIMPQIEATLSGIATLVEGLAPILADKIPVIVETLLPSIVTSITTLVQGASGVVPTFIAVLVEMLPTIMEAGGQVLGALANGVLDNLPLLLDSAFQIIERLGTGIQNNLPRVLERGFEIIKSLAQGLLNNMPTIVQAITNVVMSMLNFFREHAREFVTMGLQLIVQLAMGLLQAMPEVLNAIVQIVGELIAGAIEMAPQLLEVGVQYILKFIEGMIAQISGVASAAKEIVNSLIDVIGGIGGEAWQWGSDMMLNFIEGIRSWFGQLVNDLKSIGQTVKNFIGFSEPKMGPLSDFHTYAPDMMELFASGIRDNADLIQDAFDDSVNLETPSINTTSGYIGSQASGGASSENPIVIVVKSILDGREIGETSYKYSLQKARVIG